MIVYLARDIQAFVIYCVNGTSRSSLLIESTDSMIYVTASQTYGDYFHYAQSTDSDHPRILLRKPRIRALHNNPRIAHANLGSEDLLCKPRIRGFCCANLGSARNLLGLRNQTSAIRGNKPTIDCARKRAQAIVASLTRMAELLCVHNRLWICCRGWPRFGCTILEDCVRIRGLRARSSDYCAKARIRGLHSKILGWSEFVLCA